MWLVLAQEGPAGLDLFQILLHSSPISKIVFVVLIGCSVLSVAVIIERLIVVNRALRNTGESRELLEGWGMTRQWSAARKEIARASREVSPLFAVMQAGIANWQELVAVGETNRELLETMVSQAMSRELKLVRSQLRANLPILANVASVAPFIGLFGTVFGIILTFDAIAKKGNMGQDLVASGIADALVATAMGLFAAIPAVIAYNYFTDRVSKLVLWMEEVATEHVYYLLQERQMPAHVKAAMPRAAEEVRTAKAHDSAQAPEPALAKE